MKTNIAPERPKVLTHEGGPANPYQKSIQELERAVATCLLGEDTFYEKGATLKDRIFELASKEKPGAVAALAIKARNKWRLRHAPLNLLLAINEHLHTNKINALGLLSETIQQVIQRPDEMGELLSLYWANGKKPIPAQIKKGLASAFQKFDAYQLAKWNRDNTAIKIRDVLFMVHAKPKDKSQEDMWKQLIAGALPTPDTWETALSSGADKKETWTRLLDTKKLPYMAMLQNLRNITTAGVDISLLSNRLIEGAEKSKALPFRYLTALRACPQMAPAIETAMLRSINGNDIKIPGKTHILVDVSGSMDQTLSDKGEVTRLEAAMALAIMAREVCEHARIFTFSFKLCEVAALRGLGLAGSITHSQVHGGTSLGLAVKELGNMAPGQDRLVVITDEQSNDPVIFDTKGKNYLLNVASYKPSLDITKNWTRINGLSEQFMEWVTVEEGLDQ